MLTDGQTDMTKQVVAFCYFVNATKKRFLASPCLSVRMEHLGCHWTEFCGI